MANIKSAKKRILVNETKAARNKAIKSKVKTCVKKVETAVAKKDAAAAAEALKVAIVEILGCYGDGGAVFTDDDGLAARIILPERAQVESCAA